MISDIPALVAQVEQDLAETEELNAECGVDSSKWVEVQRSHVEALLGIARMHADCNAWTGLGPVGRALRDAVEGGRRG